MNYFAVKLHLQQQYYSNTLKQLNLNVFEYRYVNIAPIIYPVHFPVSTILEKVVSRITYKIQTENQKYFITQSIMFDCTTVNLTIVDIDLALGQ